jgi:hypothetical protein
MGLGSEMKNLSEELLASFKQRIKENEELVNDVQVTLDGFRKDHMEMTAALNANAMALRKGLAKGEKDRLHTYKDLMTGINLTIGSIQAEVLGIQNSTFNMIKEFATERTEMADGLNKFFADGRAGRMQDEKTRMKEFDALMKNINDDIKSINDEVSTILKETNNMLEKFDKEHSEMSAELRAELGKNLADRVEYTRSLLNGFQKRLSDISKENQKMAKNLRKDLANGELSRMNDYNGAIKGIRTDIKNIKKATAGMLGDLSQNRVQAASEWSKMQDAMDQIRKTGVVKAPKQTVKKAENREAPVEAINTTPVEAQPKSEPKPISPMTLEEKVLDFINKHPKGVKIAEMEEPLGETRMKLGFTAKALLDEGKVQKIENFYFPLK